MTMCPWWTGSKVPPKMATRIRTSPEIEHRLPDPYLVAFLGPGPPERPHDAALLQLPLEALDALGALPVGLEREPLHVLARDPEAPVLLADLERAEERGA